MQSGESAYLSGRADDTLTSRLAQAVWKVTIYATVFEHMQLKGYSEVLILLAILSVFWHVSRRSYACSSAKK